MYAYGPDADALYEAMEPVLEDVPLRAGSYAIKRYGEAGHLDVEQVRLELTGD